MRRLILLLLGGTVGFVVVRRLSRLAASQGGDRAGALGERLADFWADVTVLAAQREVELREALGLDGRHDIVDAPAPAQQSTGADGGVGDNR